MKNQQNTSLITELKNFIFTEKELCWTLIRQLIYFLLLLSSIIAIWKAADIYRNNLFSEHHLIENLQLFFLFISTLIFWGIGHLFQKNWGLSILLGTLTLAASIRELDAYFDQLIPFIGWKFAWIFPIIGFYYGAKHPVQFRTSLQKFFKSSAFYLMMTAMILIVPTAQALGHKNFIIAALDTPENAHLIRRMFEESIELEGYILLFFASIEYYFSLIKSKSKKGR